MKIYIYAEV